MAASSAAFPSFVPYPDDGVCTQSSIDQAETEQVISELLVTDPNNAILNRQAHISFLLDFLDGLAGPFVVLDSSRPWLIFWVTHALSLLGHTLHVEQRAQAANTLFRCIHKKKAANGGSSSGGGFGGGPGQIAHLATTYAAVMALAYVGTEKDWASIDRRAMLEWMLSLKQPDGSFVMHVGGEVDVRGCYCVLAVAYLLGIATPELVRGTGTFVAKCQTYEGGFAAAADSRSSQGEAHGGYTFCAFAAYTLLHTSTLLEDPGHVPVDIGSLMRWAAHMQGNAVEGGGFRGRTNKLVDGCYSWWNGGLFSLIDALLVPYVPDEDAEDDFVDCDDELFDRSALQKYVLLVAQDPEGGLRDKPGKSPDAYHTCYCLSGLSSVQHRIRLNSQRLTDLCVRTSVENSPLIICGEQETEDAACRRLGRSYAALMAWECDDRESHVLGESSLNRVEKTHPVLNICMPRAVAMANYFYGQQSRIRLQEV